MPYIALWCEMPAPLVHLTNLIKYKPTQVWPLPVYGRRQAHLRQVGIRQIFPNEFPAVRAPNRYQGAYLGSYPPLTLIPGQHCNKLFMGDTLIIKTWSDLLCVIGRHIRVIRKVTLSFTLSLGLLSPPIPSFSGIR